MSNDPIFEFETRARNDIVSRSHERLFFVFIGGNERRRGGLEKGNVPVVEYQYHVDPHLIREIK